MASSVTRLRLKGPDTNGTYLSFLGWPCFCNRKRGIAWLCTLPTSILLSMARQLRLDYPGALHHVTARGNAQQPIFLEDTDHHRFLTLLGEGILQQHWRCYAFCLMGNPPPLSRRGPTVSHQGRSTAPLMRRAEDRFTVVRPRPRTSAPGRLLPAVSDPKQTYRASFALI